ncbi:MAG: CDP-glycerol glycerophosphotransferase family protein [Oscillospiraceae bacterium]
MKNILIAVLRQILKIFFVFPIRKNRVFFSSYSGKNYSCNPKYICRWLLDNTGEQLEIYWAFTNPDSFEAPDKRIHKVRFKSIPYLYYLLTSRVVVDNVESWSILPRRKGQYIINTWHGGGAYKGVGTRRLDASASTQKNMLKKNERIDLYVSSSRAFTEMTLRDSFQYRGEVMECGMPRNDLLLNHTEEQRKDIREALNLEDSERLVLFAPTFRSDFSYSSDLDCYAVLEALEQRFGGEWKLLFRAHYYLDVHAQEDSRILDVTDYPDMQELLLISDVLITDYSSSIWDFSLMKKPAFLYTPDLADYQHERDFYTPIEDWPYPYSVTADGLADAIAHYDEAESADRIARHHEALGCCESAAASESVGKRIIEKCGIEAL